MHANQCVIYDTDDEGKVGDVADHDPVVDEVVGGFVLLSINGDPHRAEGKVVLHGEPGGRDDELCGDVLSALRCSYKIL